ncbi:MAG: bifunctional riboflavin kinase/FAD synthetase [Actinomycetales bacterium]|nr:bifunctional riboflavin kinase/FAD synthetase [Actinomycetales bacterium]
MRLWKGLERVPVDAPRSAVTIGKFDGVHLGHRAVLERLRREAAARGLASTVVTFDRHPLAQVDPENCPPSLVSIAQRDELLATTGVDATLELCFDAELAGQEPELFVRTVLVDAVHAGAVLTGSDFRFGHRGAGDVALLRELGGRHGFEVVVVDDVVTVAEVEPGRRISSSWIRELLAEGRVREAALLLGRRHRVRSVVVHGDAIGRELGFPTANLARGAEGFLPADAVYAAWAHVDGGRHPAAVSIGNNPTFDGVPEHQVEAHLIGASGDLYDRPIELEFVERIRGMVRFGTVEELKVALADDRDRIAELLARDATGGPTASSGPTGPSAPTGPAVAGLAPDPA